MRTDHGYTYDEETGCIRIGDATELQLFSHLNCPDGKYYIYAISLLGVKSNGVPAYCISTLQRMSPDELAGLRQQ